MTGQRIRVWCGVELVFGVLLEGGRVRLVNRLAGGVDEVEAVDTGDTDERGRPIYQQIGPRPSGLPSTEAST